MKGLFVLLLVLTLPLSGFAGEVKKIVIEEVYWIEIGDTADRVFSILDKSDQYKESEVKKTAMEYM